MYNEEGGLVNGVNRGVWCLQAYVKGKEGDGRGGEKRRKEEGGGVEKERAKNRTSAIRTSFSTIFFLALTRGS